MSKDILSHVLETTQAGYWDQDLREDTEYLSPRLTEMFGYQRHELSSWQALVYPDDAERVREAYGQYLATKEDTLFKIKARYCHRGGSVVWAQCQGKVISRDAAGQPTRVVGSHIDITAQKELEDELRHYQRALTSLKKIATNTHYSFDEQVEGALAVASLYLHLPLGIVSRTRGKVYEIIDVFAQDEVSLKKGQTFALGNTFCSLTYEADHAVGMHRVSESEQASHPCCANHGLRTYIGAPVRVRGKKYGTVDFSSPTPRDRPFSQYDLEFVEILANWIGYSLEKRNANQVLSISQKKLQAVFENSRDAIMLVDHDSAEIIDCNQMAIDLYELDRKKELIGKRGIDFHKYLFTEEQHRAYHALSQAGDFFSAEIEYITKRRNKFWGNLSVFVFTLEDRLLQWVRVVDVSTARHREQELQAIKEVLSHQARELQAANEEISSINDSLESKVRERTVALEERNRQLADFAFLNAHKMRGPLARILGLVDVLKYTNSREQEREYLWHIVQSAEELDQVIKTAANTLVTPEYAAGDGHLEKNT